MEVSILSYRRENWVKDKKVNKTVTQEAKCLRVKIVIP
jgi:hypothetical protein